MLVLSRKHGEEFVIGSNVRITVLAVQGNRVKLGITAPPEIAVRRSELDEGAGFQSVPLGEMRDHAPQITLDVVGP